MKKYIIREVEPEACDFSMYFEDDGLTGDGDEYCNTLFIIPPRGYKGLNIDRYEQEQRRAEEIIDGFRNIGTAAWQYSSRKECIQFAGIPYNPKDCHALTVWSEQADISDPESMAQFLTITTGKTWETCSVCGYNQGEYCDLVYCSDVYTSGVKHYGEVYFGCAKEFCVIEQDENGDEGMACYGYIVADSEAWTDEDYKRIVSGWAGINESDADLEMIDGCYTTTYYKYRTA